MRMSPFKPPPIAGYQIRICLRESSSRRFPTRRDSGSPIGVVSSWIYGICFCVVRIWIEGLLKAFANATRDGENLPRIKRIERILFAETDGFDSWHLLDSWWQVDDTLAELTDNGAARAKSMQRCSPRRSRHRWEVRNCGVSATPGPSAFPSNTRAAADSVSAATCSNVPSTGRTGTSRPDSCRSRIRPR